MMPPSGEGKCTVLVFLHSWEICLIQCTEEMSNFWRFQPTRRKHQWMLSWVIVCLVDGSSSHDSQKWRLWNLATQSCLKAPGRNLLVDPFEVPPKIGVSRYVLKRCVKSCKHIMFVFCILYIRLFIIYIYIHSTYVFVSVSVCVYLYHTHVKLHLVYASAVTIESQSRTLRWTGDARILWCLHRFVSTHWLLIVQIWHFHWMCWRRLLWKLEASTHVPTLKNSLR